MSKKLDDIISHELIGVPPGTSVSNTLQIMRDRNISCILILDNKKPVGIFTERDIVRSAEQFESGSLNKDIQLFVTSPVLSAEKNNTAAEAYRLMESHKIRHLVVVDDENQAVGLLTFTDLIEHLGYDYVDDLQNVSKIMSRNLSTFPRETSTNDVLCEMIDKQISCVIITDTNNRLVGIFTERDAARLLLKRSHSLKQPLETVMSAPVQTVSQTTLVKNAAVIMRDQNIRRVVVVDSDDKLKGLVTQSDIVKYIERYYQKMQRMLRQMRTEQQQDRYTNVRLAPSSKSRLSES